MVKDFHITQLGLRLHSGSNTQILLGAHCHIFPRRFSFTNVKIEQSMAGFSYLLVDAVQRSLADGIRHCSRKTLLGKICSSNLDQDS